MMPLSVKQINIRIKRTKSKLLLFLASVSINCNFISDPAFQTNEKLKGRKKRFERRKRSIISTLRPYKPLI
jgi:hypothetical protein